MGRRASNLGRRMQQEEEGESSCSSSSESNYNSLRLNSSSCLSTDLQLGLTISSSHHTSSSRQMFVKVNMEGIPFGRKLDVMAHQTYHSLVSALSQMFSVPILYPSGASYRRHKSEKDHILTYEDQDGDWMLVGDVPWEMFLNSVKKLKITKADDQ